MFSREKKLRMDIWIARYIQLALHYLLVLHSQIQPTAAFYKGTCASVDFGISFWGSWNQCPLDTEDDGVTLLNDNSIQGTLVLSDLKNFISYGSSPGMAKKWNICNSWWILYHFFKSELHWESYASFSKTLKFSRILKHFITVRILSQCRKGELEKVQL